MRPYMLSEITQLRQELDGMVVDINCTIGEYLIAHAEYEYALANSEIGPLIAQLLAL